MSDTNLPSISIITPCYRLDRLRDITELLDSIRSQTYKDIEVVIVTERSAELRDAIKAYIKGKGYASVSVLHNEGEWGSYASRNLGIQKSQGEIVAFIDDDALLFPNWAEATARAYAADSSIIGMTGPILPLWENEAMAWFPKEFYWIFSCTYWDWDEKREVRNGFATNLSFRREAFTASGLFKTSLEINGQGKADWQQPGGEETDFCLRVKQKTGKRIMYEPEVKVKHKVYGYRLSTIFIAKRAYWEGRAKVILNRLHRSGDQAVLSTEYELLRRIFSRALPGSLKLLLSKPIVALRRLWVTFLVVVCVAFGYVVGTLRGSSNKVDM